MEVDSSLHGKDTTSTEGVHQVTETETSICEALGTFRYFLHSKTPSTSQAEHVKSLVEEAARYVECMAAQLLENMYRISEAEGTNLTEGDPNRDHMVAIL